MNHLFLLFPQWAGLFDIQLHQLLLQQPLQVITQLPKPVLNQI